MISLRFVGGINTAVSDRTLVVHQTRITKVRARKDKREVHQDFEHQRFRMRRWDRRSGISFEAWDLLIVPINRRLVGQCFRTSS